MKLVCYGASVTAQQSDTGYFHNLCSSRLNQRFDVIERITFNASLFEYAGYGFIGDVLAQTPDICLIDWLTPTLDRFSNYKIILLNKTLLDQNCLPVWVFFPRTDNFKNLPEAYEQVKQEAKRFKAPFIDLLDFLPDFAANASEYLRDAVHTTKAGAEVYARCIVEQIENIHLKQHLLAAKNSEGYRSARELPFLVPSLLDIGKTISSDTSVEITFDWAGGFLEIFLDTTVGPHVPNLNFAVYRNGVSEFDEKLNPADRWCYYQRRMAVATLRRELPQGLYKVIISKGEGNPFDIKQTDKPIEESVPDESRYLEIKRLAINARATVA